MLSLLSPWKWLRLLLRLVSSLISLVVICLICLIIMVSLGSWYKHQTADQPRQWGLIWTTELESLGLTTADLEQIVKLVAFKRLQLTAPWSLVEPQNNLYDFSQVEAAFKVAQTYNLQVSLQLGLYQTGSQCYLPAWATNLKPEDLQRELQGFIKAIIEHFDDYRHLLAYQLEPEIQQADFNQCASLNLADNYEFSRQLTAKPLGLSRGANRPSFRQHSLAPNRLGLSLNPYPEPASWWSTLITNRLPASYYTFHAGNLQALNADSQIFIRRLDLLPADQLLTNQELVRRRLEYAQGTNLKDVDLYRVDQCYAQAQQGNQACWQVLTDFIAANL